MNELINVFNVLFCLYFLALLFLSVWRRLPCKWFGPHDWETIDIYTDRQTRHVYTDKVCLACYKKSSEVTQYREYIKHQQAEANARKVKAYQLWRN